MHSSAISKVISRSQAEVDFVTETLPTLGYIVNAIIKSAEDASSLKGDSIPQGPQLQAGVSKTPFIDAGKLFVQKLFDPVPCSACVLEKLHLRGTVANLRALEGACFHEEPPSRFEHVGKQCMEEQVTDTEIQQSLEGVLSLLTLYSQEVIRHRQTRAALDESMSIFTDRVTAVALRSAEELDFVMERVPFVGWIVDTAGKMRHEYPVQVDVLSVGLGELN
ncbi:hypothetical protein VKT23_000509 [Stygiomarasmius scandens]|uniref:Uncharacterized protein n=1 Tax=Marasmiellus scandens TaxID=2682957 RepID=A0ABR1K4Q0_9AGAR